MKISSMFILLKTGDNLQEGRLDDPQAGIKIAGRNINNLRYVDDITLVAGSELKSLLLRVKQESEKASLKLDIATMEDDMEIP